MQYDWKVSLKDCLQLPPCPYEDKSKKAGGLRALATSDKHLAYAIWKQGMPQNLRIASRRSQFVPQLIHLASFLPSRRRQRLSLQKLRHMKEAKSWPRLSQGRACLDLLRSANRTATIEHSYTAMRHIGSSESLAAHIARSATQLASRLHYQQRLGNSIGYAA